MSKIVVVAALMLVPAFSGCLDFLPPEIREPIEEFVGTLQRPDATVYATIFEEGEWNRINQFQAEVLTDEPFDLRIEVEPPEGGALTTVDALASGAILDEATGKWSNEIELVLPDGIWVMRLYIDDKLWKEWNPLMIDGHLPVVNGLEVAGNAVDGTYTIGTGAKWEAGATVEVRNPNGIVIADTLPVTVQNLIDGIHLFRVVFEDGAGNQLTRVVQVLVGEATELPAGKYTAGVVARYTNRLALWDLARADEAVSRASAAIEQPDFLGDGFGITPNEPAVRAVVDSVVTPDMNTMEAAMALFRWLYDELEYDENRLASNTLMLPVQAIEDSEDPDAETGDGDDAGDDGLADFGPGNGVHGGVCRDLAATYVSLLRAADVPARLVTGYLAGNVNGFHAWVEFYAGDVAGQRPWVPVDVSPIDGTWNADENNDGNADGIGVMMQAFGIRLPHYLPLRALPSDAEQDSGWATAIGLSYQFSGAPPQFSYEKSLKVESQGVGYLCFDPTTYARKSVGINELSQCEGMHYFGGQASSPFILQSTQVIDYGVKVADAKGGKEMTIRLAMPYASEIQPVTVDILGPYVSHNNPNGKVPVPEDGPPGKMEVTLKW